MVTIIKPGTKKIAKCNKCGCEFSYEDEDKKIHLHKIYIPCPQCNEEYIIEQTREIGTEKFLKGDGTWNSSDFNTKSDGYTLTVEPSNGFYKNDSVVRTTIIDGKEVPVVPV